MSNPNDPASPIRVPGLGDEYREIHLGMTIRQQFVMAAMQGICARTQGGGLRATAEAAVLLADATLAEEARTRAKA